jgi:hypothetical protein
MFILRFPAIPAPPWLIQPEYSNRRRYRCLQRGIFGIQKVTLCSNEGLTTMASENGRRSV